MSDEVLRVAIQSGGIDWITQIAVPLGSAVVGGLMVHLSTRSVTRKQIEASQKQASEHIHLEKWEEEIRLAKAIIALLPDSPPINHSHPYSETYQQSLRKVTFDSSVLIQDIELLIDIYNSGFNDKSRSLLEDIATNVFCFFELSKDYQSAHRVSEQDSSGHPIYQFQRDNSLDNFFERVTSRPLKNLPLTRRVR